MPQHGSKQRDQLPNRARKRSVIPGWGKGQMITLTQPTLNQPYAQLHIGQGGFDWHSRKG
jgi:hypothetical protein